MTIRYLIESLVSTYGLLYLVLLPWIYDVGGVPATMVLRSQKLTEHVHKIADLRTDGGIIDLQFIDESEGWIADGSKLWHTVDGGKEWLCVYEKEKRWGISSYFRNVRFDRKGIGWMTETVRGSYRSDDRGHTWARQLNPFEDGPLCAFRMFEDGVRGFASAVATMPNEGVKKNNGWSEYAVVARTSDGARTWQAEKVRGTRAITSFYLNADDETVWGLGWPGLFYFRKAEHQWGQVDFGVGEEGEKLLVGIQSGNVIHSPTALTFLNANLGWACFENGLIAGTTNGGRTWREVVRGRDIFGSQTGLTYFTGIHFIDSRHGWAVGFDSLYGTFDGGNRWARVDIPARFLTLFFLDAEHGWAVAKDGVYRINS